MGMTLTELKKAVGDVIPQKPQFPSDDTTYRYTLKSTPIKNAIFKEYEVELTPKHGICNIRASVFTEDEYGKTTKFAQEIYSNLAAIYGKMTKYDNKVFPMYIWRYNSNPADQIMISLSYDDANYELLGFKNVKPNGFIWIDYYAPFYAECYKEILDFKQQKAKSAGY